MMTIEERLANTERELGRVMRRNRWLLGAILIMIIVIAGSWIVARAQWAGTVKEIRARRILIEDENDKVRAALTASGLSLYDEKGLRAGLNVNKDGPKLVLYDENFKASAGLNQSLYGASQILNDENGKTGAWLQVSKEGPSLSLLDGKGETRFAAGKTKTVSPDGKTIEHPESSLILFGPDGKVIWSAIK